MPILLKVKEMVLQFKLKSSEKKGKWKDYNGKNRLKFSTSKYYFRLLSSNRKKVLVDKSSYKKVMKRFRQIEFFKRQ